jgi:hypothetical protein
MSIRFMRYLLVPFLFIYQGLSAQTTCKGWTCGDCAFSPAGLDIVTKPPAAAPKSQPSTSTLPSADYLYTAEDRRVYLAVAGG